MDRGAENASPDRSPDRGSAFSPGEIERIGALWRPAEWPEATGAYAKTSYLRSFEYHVERVRHLGLSGGLLIDAGCGAGQWAFAWATRFGRVMGIDITPRWLAAANWQKERFDVPAVEFIGADVRRLPVAAESADVVYCNGVIFGVFPIEPVLQEFFRVLKPGGICYLGLHGLGFAYERARGEDPRLADLGRRRIYNTLCRRHLTSLIGAIAPGGARNVEAAACLQRGMPTKDLLVSLDCGPDQVIAAETVASDLGPGFSQRLLDDLAAINAGTKTDFGDREAGREWDADEMSVAGRGVGFGRSEWAPDGWLSLRANGSIVKRPSAKVRPGRHEFEGRPRVFEMLLWKPPKKTSRASYHPVISPREQVDVANIKRKANVKQNLKIGMTTYWNEKPSNIVKPIIDLKPPVLLELEGAIITPRDIDPKISGPKDGQVRYARGGIYDRDHQILPVFLEREAHELSLSNANRLRNDPVIADEYLKEIDILRGTYLYLGILRPHFGHFLLESLCRVWYILKARPTCKIIVHGSESMTALPSYVKYIFGLLDLDPSRLVGITRTSVVDHLLLPESEFEIRWRARASYADTFRELQDRSSHIFPTEPTPRRIYLTRRFINVKNAADRRKVVNNEEDVEKIFSKRGFTIIAPEKLPFHEQIALAAGAGQLAGMKGSALHMSLFCQRPEARLVQIGRVPSVNQALINGLKDMEGHQILCQSAATENGSDVDLEIIRAAVRAM